MSEQYIKKSDFIAKELCNRVIRGKFEPGEKLAQDLIAREFNVSQVTVREALMRLASQGLAISLPRRGMCVAPMDKGAAAELRVMRCALEPIALQHSVPNLTPAQVQEIERIHDLCNEAKTCEEWEDANQDFHLATIAACNMPRLITEIRNLQLLYIWHFHKKYIARWRKRDDPDHAAILSAIKDRDADRARLAMQRHLARML